MIPEPGRVPGFLVGTTPSGSAPNAPARPRPGGDAQRVLPPAPRPSLLRRPPIERLRPARRASARPRGGRPSPQRLGALATVFAQRLGTHQSCSTGRSDAKPAFTASANSPTPRGDCEAGGATRHARLTPPPARRPPMRPTALQPKRPRTPRATTWSTSLLRAFAQAGMLRVGVQVVQHAAAKLHLVVLLDVAAPAEPNAAVWGSSRRVQRSTASSVRASSLIA